ncbi:MAG: adenosine deaminase [Acidobacteria bacterium]|nr:adenosine deaminase [Acidobacteriota bacterium]MBV9145761.1 adenosine deaminase [Acidobacteriota bacterium]
MSRLRFAFLYFFLCACAFAQTPGQETAKYFDSIRTSPPLLEAFLREMPKGGDLHNHLSGAVYAESYIQYAIHDNLCVTQALAFTSAPCAETSVPAASALTNAVLYRELLDALSMRDFHAFSQAGLSESGEDHFFATFGRFGMVSRVHTGEMLAEVASRAGRQNESYLELTLGLDRLSAAIGTKVGWDEDFDRMRQKLTAAGIDAAIPQTRKALDDAETEKNRLLHCDGSARADPGCKVTIRYIHEVYRGTPKEQVFAEIMTGFALAKADHRYVAINPVMPEDGLTSMSDYDLHMRMFDYFHKLYPDVHLTEHAGELAPGLVPPEGLRLHIREAVEVGHAQRIGHGVDVMEEDRPIELLREMAEKHVAVEICLTSNDLILGVSGDRHPFPVYRKFGVPVVIATDDEGVSRSDMTHEYLRAVQGYALTYSDLKKLVRDSIDYSFAEPQVKEQLGRDLNSRFAQFESIYGTELRNPGANTKGTKDTKENR